MEIASDISIYMPKGENKVLMSKIFSGNLDDIKLIDLASRINPSNGKSAANNILSRHSVDIFNSESLLKRSNRIIALLRMGSLESESFFPDLLMFLDVLIPNVHAEALVCDDEGGKTKFWIKNGKLYEGIVLLNDFRFTRTEAAYDATRFDDYFYFATDLKPMIFSKRIDSGVLDLVRELEPKYKSYTDDKILKEAKLYGGRIYLEDTEGKPDKVLASLEKAKEYFKKGIVLYMETGGIGDVPFDVENLRSYMSRYWKEFGDPRSPYSIGRLLKGLDISLTPAKENKILIAKGVIEEKERASKADPKKLKKYKVLTEKGLKYGVNDDSGHGETQPKYYEFMFKEFSNKYLLS